jgi:hypothetical protein
MEKRAIHAIIWPTERKNGRPLCSTTMTASSVATDSMNQPLRNRSASEPNPSRKTPNVRMSNALDGQAELTSRRELALEWYAQLQAPIKRVFTFANAAHSVSLEEFQAFHRILLERIVPETYLDQ